MAIDLGLTTNEKLALKTLLVTSHRIKVTIQLLDLSHNYLADLTPMLLSGQVDMDADATDSTRSLTVDLLDPKKKLALDGESPDDGSIYYARMFKVIYTVMSIDRSLRFDIPIFCGPLSGVQRNGAVVSCTALGKEKLAMSIIWQGRSYKAHASKNGVLMSILTDIAGETPSKINIVKNSKPKMPNKLVMDRQKTAWPVAKSIAASMSKFLMYDGRGVAQTKSIGKQVQYTFTTKGGQSSLLSDPTVSFDAENVVNCVQVIGGKPKKAKNKITYRVVAPRNHPLSPWQMGRYGKPRYLPYVVEDDSILSKAEARRVARETLKQLLIEQIEVTFDSLPIPFLEENDLCKLISDEYSGMFRLKKMSIPLTADGTCSIGYNRKTVPSKRAIKLRNTKRKRTIRR